jgi:anti-sigma factor RsiW
LDCSEYIGKYLAAQADDELAPHECRVAGEHLAKCAACRALLAEERSLKALLRRNAGVVRTPPDVRLRIRAALGEIAETNLERQANYPNRTAVADRDNTAREGSDRGRAGVIRHGVARWSRNGLWASAGGVAAVLIVTLAIFAGRATNRPDTKSNPAVPAFDTAISKYLSFQRGFAPNLPPEAYSNADGAVYAWVQNRDPVQPVATEASDKFDDVARAYREMSMPDDLLDLSPAGYALSGGRADHLPDGRPVTYTLYTSGSGTILNICYPDSSMAAPIGAINWLGMRSFYEYRGYSICMSFYPAGHFVSILLSRMPVRQLLDYVAMADATAAGN